MGNLDFASLFPALSAFTWQNLIMITVGATLIYLAIKKEYEPTLLLPMGFGAILVNIPFGSALAQLDPSGQWAEGALCGFDLYQAASIGIIGAADGPTSIFVANKFAPDLLGPISVAAYSYMALDPIIQPPVIRAITSKKERRINMTGGNNSKPVSRTTMILFPIVVTVIAGIIAPASLALVGFLMFGNLIRECGVLNKLSLGAQNELANLVTILLGITIASTMTAERFVRLDTLMIIGLGLFAFVFDTFGGVMFAKLMNLFMPKHMKVNPMVGACGISAFPMSARVIHNMGQKEDKTNFLLMPAISTNVGGQIGSVVAGGLILALIPLFA